MLIKTKELGRKTGIDNWVMSPGATHFCLFYKTQKDLLDMIARCLLNKFMLLLRRRDKLAETRRTELYETLK